MGRLLTVLTFVALVASLACNGGGDGPPDSRGIVRDKRHDDAYELKIEGVTTHNRTLWWQEVTSRVYANCQVGETWDEDDPNGCS